MKRTLSVTLAALLLAVPAEAAISFTTLQVGGLFDSSGSDVALGTIAILVVDANGNGFSGSTANTYTSIAGTTLTAGQNLGGSDDQILKVFSASDLGGDFGIDSSLTGYSFSGSIGAGDNLALYWFPGVTAAGSSLQANQSEMGFYRNDSVDSLSGSDFAWKLPNDNDFGSLAALSTSLGGPVPNGSLTAFNMVPEPSRVLFLAFGALGFFVRRRRA